jgi:predicted ArsR family transcriptional regulator
MRVLRALCAADRPVTVAGLARTLGGHPNAARVQLDQLVDAGFAAVSTVPPAGRGRPSLAYAPTVSGRQVASQDGGLQDQLALVEAVADVLADDADPRASAVAVGRAWGLRIAARHGTTPDLEGLLARQGFTPRRVDGGLALQTCPLLDAARRRPVVCQIHQGLIDVVSPDQCELRPFAVPGACIVAMAR